MELLEAFVPFTGGSAPVTDDTYVEALIVTSEGISSSQVIPGKLVAWHHHTPLKLGDVVGYRPSHRSDQPLLGAYARIPIGRRTPKADTTVKVAAADVPKAPISERRALAKG